MGLVFADLVLPLTQNRRRIVEPGGGYGQVVMAYRVIR